MPALPPDLRRALRLEVDRRARERQGNAKRTRVPETVLRFEEQVAAALDSPAFQRIRAACDEHAEGFDVDYHAGLIALSVQTLRNARQTERPQLLKEV